jgi:hypothetical protein
MSAQEMWFATNMVLLMVWLAAGTCPEQMTRILNAASKCLHHHRMSFNFIGLLASGKANEAINIPTSVCHTMRQILKYRVILLVAMFALVVECNVIE